MSALFKQAGLPRALRNAIKAGKKFPKGSPQAKAIEKYTAGKQKHTQDWFKKNRAENVAARAGVEMRSRGAIDRVVKAENEASAMGKSLGGTGDHRSTKGWGFSTRDGKVMSSKLDSETAGIKKRRWRKAWHATSKRSSDPHKDWVGYTPPERAFKAHADRRAAAATKRKKDIARKKRNRNIAIGAGTALGLGGAALTGRHFYKKKNKKKTAGAQSDPRLTRAGVSGYNKPRRTPGHSTKSHIVVAREGGQVKTIRFGQQGVRTNQTAGQRKAFKSRHARNISRGRMSAAYWADKVKWSPSKTKDKANQKWVKGS